MKKNHYNSFCLPPLIVGQAWAYMHVSPAALFPIIDSLPSTPHPTPPHPNPPTPTPNPFISLSCLGCSLYIWQLSHFCSLKHKENFLNPNQASAMRQKAIITSLFLLLLVISLLCRDATCSSSSSWSRLPARRAAGEWSLSSHRQKQVQISKTNMQNLLVSAKISFPLHEHADCRNYSFVPTCRLLLLHLVIILQNKRHRTQATWRMKTLSIILTIMELPLILHQLPDIPRRRIYTTSMTRYV